MNGLLNALAEFITAPILRWIFVFLSIIINLIKFLNEPQRYSYAVAFTGLSYKWHMYLIAVITAVSCCFMTMGLWLTIPFTKNLPDNWYMYLFIISLAIITQITVDTKQISDDGSFNPPPTYMLPDKYRIMLTFASLIINIVNMIQTYVYFGIADLSKKTVISRYFLERFGGFNAGNKLDFIFDWSGLLDIVISMYVLYLQSNFQACDYGLPRSWNF